MKICLVVFLSVLLLACGENRVMLPAEESFVETAGATASFNFRNGEMREMLLTRAEEVGVDVWMIDERSIGYVYRKNKGSLHSSPRVLCRETSTCLCMEAQESSLSRHSIKRSSRSFAA